MNTSAFCSYAGRRVVVAGGGGTGMGAATVRLLRDLGAEVVVLDRREPTADGVSFVRVDLGDPADIDRAVERLGSDIRALFNCQGITGAGLGATGSDVMRVNFLGVRHLTEAIVALMPPGSAVASISSTGGLGWHRKKEIIDELLDTEGFDAGLRWADKQADDLLAVAFPNAYAFSKQALIAWTMRRAVSAIDRRIRVNCTSPGATRTAMAGDFPQQGVEFTRRPIGRDSEPEEQAWPIVYLNSPAASYVNGVNLVVDGGHSAARTMGLLAQ